MAGETFEIRFQTEGQGEAVAAYEQLRLKELAAKDETTRLAGELRKLQRSGTATSSEIEDVSRSLIRAKDATRAYARQASELTQQQTATAVQSLDARQKIEQLGSTVGQVGAVVGRVNPELGRMGAVIGNIGASLPGLTGSLGPVAQAVAAINVAIDIGTAAWELWTQQTGRAAERAQVAADHIRDLTTAIREQAQAQEALSGLSGIESVRQQAQQADEERRGALRAAFEAEAEIARLTGQQFSEGMLSELRSNLAETGVADDLFAALGLGGRQEELREQIALYDTANRQVAERTQLLEGLAEAEDIARQAAELEEGASGRAAPEEATAGLRRTRERPSGAAQRRAEEQAAYEEAERQRSLQEEIEYAAAIEQLDRDQYDRRQQLLERLADAQQAYRDREYDREQEFQDRLAAAEAERAEQTRQNLKIRAERAQEESAELAASVGGNIQDVSGSMNQLLGQTISFLQEGGDLASEQYTALLDSFLESTAIEYTIRALAEAGQAIAAAASQNYAGAVQHGAAAAVYGAVATLAGGASVAIPNVPTQQAQPVQPQQPLGGGGTTNNTVNLYTSQAVFTERERGELVNRSQRALRRESGASAARP